MEQQEELDFAMQYHDVPQEMEDIVPADFRSEADQFLKDNNFVICRQTARAIYVALINR